MNAIVSDAMAPRSVVEERSLRPPIIGKIRPGIKVVKSALRANAKVVDLYDQMVAAGESYETIGKVIENRFRINNALVPKNVPYFVCRRSDFRNPVLADQILDRYGEDRGEGRRLYRFPVLFMFNDWMQNVPNQMTCWAASGLKFFSEYDANGIRHCKTYQQPEIDERASRVKRNFGGRTVIFRQDEAIPDGVCDPERCPQYQGRQCNLSASFIFAIPEIKGLGLIELPTNSIYVLQKAYAAMQTVRIARGRLLGTHFWLSKQEIEITRLDERGQPTRQKQQLTVLDAEIDMGALLDAGDEPVTRIVGEPPSLTLVHNHSEVSETVHVDEKQEGSVDAGTSVNTDMDAVPTEAEPPAVEYEDLQAKHDRLSDLLARLGIKTDALKNAFAAYARQHFERGWPSRPSDVDAMNATLAAALSDIPAFHRLIQMPTVDLFTD
ncbi:recombination directionality factor [Robbsia andropogonis]|uniref:recombination directionality factor n=1 Tax=Robbsia andropogonis TaxID=28092 RepID=UPI0020A0BEBA|nr:hypothetical protein [Robbsia andropogonis]MCP1121518.1 hypothetical protein [Robbsia andropogonis]MCP1131338.1 hypothetical protein [Robbsia andropogonis]